MITCRGLGKRFGDVQAVRDLSFDVRPGVVTGFLGPNGAGKSTTMRLMLDLDRGLGETRFAGRRYRDLVRPLHVVGAVREARSFHPTRRARDHLWMLAAATGLPAARADEVLERVGLAGLAHARPNGFSLGMSQRLALAAALLGDPDVLILDEPANGLDPPGIRWIRGMLREQAERGRAVLVSSHLLSEVAQSVDDVVVISHGTLRASGTLESVLGSSEGGPATRVRSEDDGKLASALERQGMSIARDPAGGLTGTGAGADAVGRVANDERIALVELTPVSRSLEEAFFELTEGEKE